MTIPFNLCVFCQRLHHAKAADAPQHVCDAFPQGIPDAIYWKSGMHFDPYPGDNGLQFLPRPGFEDMEANWRDPVRREYERQEVERIEQWRQER